MVVLALVGAGGSWTAGEGRCAAGCTCNVSHHVAIVHVATTYSCVVLAYTCHCGVLVGRAGLNMLKVSVPHTTLGRTLSSSKCLPSSKAAKLLSPHKSRLGLVARLLRHLKTRHLGKKRNTRLDTC